MANLSPQQRQLVEQWAAEGANLNQIQDRLRAECEMTLTYMETRLLILDLGVKIQEKPREAPPVEKPAPAPADQAETTALPGDAAAGLPAGDIDLKITVDDVPPAGAIVSGKATFSDGNNIMWFLDQMGRFGMRGPTADYKPPAADIPVFQRELDTILQLRGF